MHTYTLERGVPMTFYGQLVGEAGVPSHREVVSEHRYPWQDMEIGESFHANMPDNQLWFDAKEAEARFGIHLVVRVEPPGSRVWRVVERPPSNRGRKMEYPWTTLEVGEAFVIEHKKQNSVRPVVARAKRMYNRSFSVTPIGAGSEPVVERVLDWRVERVA